jgi:hypothetical protein
MKNLFFSKDILCCCCCCPDEWATNHECNWSWLEVVDDDDECISLLPLELLLLLLLLFVLLKWKRVWSKRYCCCSGGWKYWCETFGGEGVAVISKRWCFKESGDEVFDEQVDVDG